jgi:RyR domain
VSSFEEGVVLAAYFPKTIDTSSIELSSDLRELVERMAENNHDHWARKRLDEGWHYGPKRNDAEKTHPGLVPYGELSESEKEYDRTTVVEAIKAIMALGYDVKRR